MTEIYLWTCVKYRTFLRSSALNDATEQVHALWPPLPTARWVLPPALRQLRAWQWAQLSARLDADCDGVLVRPAFPLLCGPF